MMLNIFTFSGDSRKRPGDPLQFGPPFLLPKQPRLMMGPGMFPLLPASIAPSHLPGLQAATLPPHMFNWHAMYESCKAAIGAGTARFVSLNK